MIKPQWFFLTGEIVLTTALAILIGLRGDPVVWVFVVWLAFSKMYHAWYLSSQIEEIGSRLGFGVSVPVAEMPKVLRDIESRIERERPTTANAIGNCFGVDLNPSSPKRKRANRGLLDELTALETETQ